MQAHLNSLDSCCYEALQGNISDETIFRESFILIFSCRFRTQTLKYKNLFINLCCSYFPHSLTLIRYKIYYFLSFRLAKEQNVSFTETDYKTIKLMLQKRFFCLSTISYFPSGLLMWYFDYLCPNDHLGKNVCKSFGFLNRSCFCCQKNAWLIFQSSYNY